MSDLCLLSSINKHEHFEVLSLLYFNLCFHLRIFVLKASQILHSWNKQDLSHTNGLLVVWGLEGCQHSPVLPGAASVDVQKTALMSVAF